jgi:hypothetical protein
VSTNASIQLAVTVPSEAVERIARRTAVLVSELLLTERDADRWLDTREAATYLGLTPNALHKLTAARQIPFAQDVPGGKCWFLRSELSAWRRAGVTEAKAEAHRSDALLAAARYTVSRYMAGDDLGEAVARLEDLTGGQQG